MHVNYSIALRLGKRLERVTPDIVFKEGNALNYAYLRTVGISVGRILIRGYEGSPVVDLGEKLAAVLDGPDEGMAGDVRESNEWAAILGISGWFD